MSSHDAPVGETRESVDSTENSNDNQEKRIEGSVKYENYQRVLSEKRKVADENQSLRAKLAEFEAEDKRRHEAELKKQNKFKELLEQREKEIHEAKSELAGMKKQRESAKKLDAVLRKIPGSIDSEYWVLIDTDSVIYDSETGQVDPTSVDAVAKDFIERHSRLIDRPGNSSPDNKAPKGHDGNTGKLSYDEWLKLSPKDKKARFQDIDGAPDWMVGKNSHFKKVQQV